MSPTPNMPLISPSSEDYLPLAQLESEVFSTDPISILAWGPQQYTEAALAVRAGSLASAGSSPPMASKTFRIRMAVTESREIVGYAFWKFLRDPAWNDGPKTAANEEQGSSWPEGANFELCDRVFGDRGANKNYVTNMKGKKHATLSILIVHPAYQGRGLGKQLILDGLAIADEENLPVWLASTEVAVKFYEKVGFEVNEVMLIDLKEFGVDKVEKHIPMVRKAKS